MTIRYAPPTRRLAVAVVLLALTAAGAAGKPLPLGPEISISHPGYCPGLAGRTDGTFAVAWPGFLPPDRITMSVRGGRLGGSLGSASVVAVEAAGLTGDTEAAATAAGYTVVWQAVREDRSSPHFALA
ncbi:MAG TPA: hypothetical protein VFS60_12740, partial [Thermoanaerobaculia bacterium]|nr:hypothetical protein [Thermoanaerobaculia bacterium]